MDWYTRCIIGIAADAGVDEGGRRGVGALPVVSAATGGAGLAARRGLARARHPPLGAGGRRGDRAGRSLALARRWCPRRWWSTTARSTVSEHLTSVCRRMGISIQPARLRTGRDKGPVERFFRTLREDLLQALPGYKGPDIHSRGVNPEDDAFFFLDELEAIIREWIATVYHRTAAREPARSASAGAADVPGEDVRARHRAGRLHRGAPRPAIWPSSS